MVRLGPMGVVLKNPLMYYVLLLLQIDADPLYFLTKTSRG